MSKILPMNILVVEDDPDELANLRDILELDDHHVETAGTMAEALATRDWSRISVVLMDWRLPDGDAETLLPHVRRLAPDAAVIVSTGQVGLSGAVLALRHGAADYIIKPIDVESLRASLARIGEQKRLLLEKQRSEAVFRNLVETAGSMIVILRENQSIAYFSPFAEQLTGFSAAGVVGSGFPELFLREEDRKGVAQIVQDTLAGTPQRGYESPILCRDGSARWLAWNAQRLDDYEGQPAVLAVGLDITERKWAEERLVQAERLSAIGEAMTGIAHESRNALARGQAALDMLGRRIKDRPDLLEYLGRMQRAQDDLHQLYEDVREYAAPIRLDFQPCNLSEVLNETWEHLAPKRKDRKVRLSELIESSQTGDDVDLCCEADRFAMRQVLRNILENSLSACEDDVEINVEYSEAMLHGEPVLRIAVRDNGPGLSPEQKQRIFESFYTTKTHGTGLGMAICKRIIDGHHGRIAVGNPSGPGMEIVITLPRTRHESNSQNRDRG